MMESNRKSEYISRESQFSMKAHISQKQGDIQSGQHKSSEIESKNKQSMVSIADSQLEFLIRPQRADENMFTYYLTLQKIATKLENQYKNQDGARIFYRIYKGMRPLKTILLFLYVFITFFQRPNWCDDSFSEYCEFDKNGNQITLATTYFIPNKYYYTIEVVAIAFLWFMRIMKYCISKNNNRTAIIFEAVINISHIYNDIYIRSRWNFSTLLTPLIVIWYSARVQTQLMHFWRILNKGKSVLFLMAFNIFIYAGLGKVFLDDSKDNPIFEKDFIEIIKIFFMLITTDNQPDIFLKYYAKSYWNSIFFISFQFINTVLLLNFLIVVFFTEYTKDIQNETNLILEKHQNKIRYIQMSYLYRKSIKDKVLELIETNPPELPEHKLLSNLLRSRIYRTMMVVVCLKIFHLIFVDLTQSNGMTNIILNGLLLMEELIIIQQLGFKDIHDIQFILRRKGQFLGIIQSGTIIICQMIYFIINSNYILFVMKLLMLHRFFRPSQMFLRSSQFSKIVVQIVQMIPQLVDLLAVFFIQLLFWAALGQMLFGAHVHHQQADLIAANGYNPQYVYVSFNDTITGMISCWCLLVISNWHNVAETFCLIMGNQVYMLFFIAYYISVVLVMVNVCMSILIDFLYRLWSGKTNEPKSSTVENKL